MTCYSHERHRYCRDTEDLFMRRANYQIYSGFYNANFKMGVKMCYQDEIVAYICLSIQTDSPKF